MIPILFDRNTLPKTIINNNTLGLGMLNDCISATVTEELNGSYELVIEYPITGAHFHEIEYCSWIKAKPCNNPDEDVQLFRVYKISKPIDGICSIYAEHVSYLLSYAIVEPANGLQAVTTNVAGAIDQIDAHILQDEYKWWGTPSGAYSFELIPIWASSDFPFVMNKALSIRDYLLGEDERSIKNVYGPAECWFTNFSVLIYPPGGRGENNGVKIRYGKGLTNLKMDVSDENILTGYYPYFTKLFPPEDQSPRYNDFLFYDIGTFDPERPRVISYAPAVEHFGFYPRTISLNLADFDKWSNLSAWDATHLTLNDFYDCVDMYMHSQGITDYGTLGSVSSARRSIDVSFMDLATTEEYQNILPLEVVNLGDTVTIEFPEFGISEEQRVIKTEYNVLEERYNQLTLGAPFNKLY